jgi:hypothetical protein
MAIGTIAQFFAQTKQGLAKMVDLIRLHAQEVKYHPQCTFLANAGELRERLNGVFQ